MTTPWQELTLSGGWAKAQIPPPIASGVNAPSATCSVSLPTSRPTITITQYGRPPQIEIAAYYLARKGTAEVRTYRFPQSWFSGPFRERWTYTRQVRYHPALREVIGAYAADRVLASRSSPDAQPMPGRYPSLMSRWKYRLLVHFQPLLRAVIKMYAARIAVTPAQREP